MNFKKYLTGLFIGLVFFSAAGIGEAKSQVMDMKVSDDLSQIKAIYVKPLEFSGEEMGESEQLKIRLILQNQFLKNKVPLIWDETMEKYESVEDKSTVGILEIDVTRYTWDNYWRKGYYEEYTDTVYEDVWVWEKVPGEKRRERRRVTIERPVIRTRYVPPKLMEVAVVDVRMILKNGETDEPLWYYTQSRRDTDGFFAGNPSPERSLKTIGEEAVKAFEKKYKSDEKARKKINK